MERDAIPFHAPGTESLLLLAAHRDRSATRRACIPILWPARGTIRVFSPVQPSCVTMTGGSGRRYAISARSRIQKVNPTAKIGPYSVVLTDFTARLALACCGPSSALNHQGPAPPCIGQLGGDAISNVPDALTGTHAPSVNPGCSTSGSAASKCAILRQAGWRGGRGPGGRKIRSARCMTRSGSAWCNGASHAARLRLGSAVRGPCWRLPKGKATRWRRIWPGVATATRWRAGGPGSTRRDWPRCFRATGRPSARLWREGAAADPDRGRSRAESGAGWHGDMVAEHAAGRAAAGVRWSPRGQHLHDRPRPACRGLWVAKEPHLVRNRGRRAQAEARWHSYRHGSGCRRNKGLIERAYTLGASLGLAVWCEDEAGPFQAVPHPGSSWQPHRRPATQPHEYIRGGTCNLLTLFHPATGQVPLQPVSHRTNPVLHG
jgi:hypothetical protein